MIRHFNTLQEFAKANVIGQAVEHAANICTQNGFVYRWVAVDGRHLMVTQDIKPDRIGFTINDGIVTDVQVG